MAINHSVPRNSPSVVTFGYGFPHCDSFLLVRRVQSLHMVLPAPIEPTNAIADLLAQSAPLMHPPMNDSIRNIAVLGSTGSIGTSALEVIAASNGRLKAIALTANRRFALLVEQARTVRPRWVVATDANAAREFDWIGLPDDCELLLGADALLQVVADPNVDVVLAAIVGIAGLASTWAAVDAKKRVALANKETLVAAGSLVMDLARERRAEIIPVDSEHSAVFQALACGKREQVSRVILTASGGPFRDLPIEQLNTVTVEDALNHPTWSMGRKITVDSATMMNKALEIIEARWLFDLRPDQIDVTIHPQSVVHSLVEYVDGSVVAQLSPPDMRLPIQYAFDYPKRYTGPTARLDWTNRIDLSFEPAAPNRFPALALGYEVARLGGTAGAVLSAANEAAVAAFLDGQICFNEIVPACRRVLESHSYDPSPTLNTLLDRDRWARREISHCV